MKFYLVSFIYCLSVMTMAQKVIGNGEVIVAERNIDRNFEGVKSSGSIDIIILEGKKNGKITLEGESNVLDYVETKVENGILTIQLKPGKYHLKNGIRASFAADQLNTIVTSGSGDISSKGKLLGQHISLTTKGSGDLSINLEANQVEVTSTGSGDIELKGKTKNLMVNSRGSGDLKAYDLKANDVNLTKSGSGDAEIQLSGRLNVQSTGSGNVYYKGKYSDIQVNSRGSGKVIESR